MDTGCPGKIGSDWEYDGELVKPQISGFMGFKPFTMGSGDFGGPSEFTMHTNPHFFMGKLKSATRRFTQKPKGHTYVGAEILEETPSLFLPSVVAIPIEHPDRTDPRKGAGRLVMTTSLNEERSMTHMACAKNPLWPLWWKGHQKTHHFRGQFTIGLWGCGFLRVQLDESGWQAPRKKMFPSSCGHNRNTAVYFYWTPFVVP